MISYELKVESGDEAIEITAEGTIYFAEVFLDTINNDTQKKSNAILARVTIQGNIDASINDNLIKFSEWARDLNAKTTYRKVTLTVKKDATTILRMYEIPDMFVCDYREVYGNPSDDKTAFFELNLTQKETKLKDFKTC